jgi:hypothetical protein
MYNQMNTIMSKIKTTPQMMGRLDPEWDRKKRIDYLKAFGNGCTIGAYLGFLLCIFMFYKGCEKAIKQDNINKQQNYDSIR